MKTLFKVLSGLFLIISSTSAETTITMRGEAMPGKSHLSLMVAGSQNYPKKLFAENYGASDGFSLGIGFAITPEEKENIHVGSFYLRYYHDKFVFNEDVQSALGIDNKNNASVSGVYFGGDIGLPLILFKKSDFAIAPSVGTGYGVAWFSMVENSYEHFGKTTLTELKTEKDKKQYSSCYQLGLLLTGVSHVSLKYSYDFINIERELSWHTVVSEATRGLIVSELPKYLSLLFDEDIRSSTFFGITKLAYQITTSVLWHNFTYDHHNWPFDDEPPLRFNRQLVTLNLF